MATQLFQFFRPFTTFYHHGFSKNEYKMDSWRCFAGGRSGGSNWDWERTVRPNQGSRFRNEYVKDEYDDEAEFGYRNTAKQRTWWSDEFYEDGEEEEDEGFGILEGSIGFNWIFKVVRAFGWMVPAIVISSLLGTGTNTIIMAIALPLAQSALSLVTDAVLGGSGDASRPKPKSKKWSYARGTSNTRAWKDSGKKPRTRKETGDYRSWAAGDNVSKKNRKGNRQEYGGWDELDKQVIVDKVPNMASIVKANEQSNKEKVKMNRRTNRDTPLLIRLLIAAFPFLGFWNKLL